MDITFLIGNGFDLSVGLKTRYTDFYPYYFYQAESPNAPVDVFKESIGKDLITWADAEVALGECTGKYTLKQAQNFRDCCDDFLSKLSAYLILQEKKFTDINKESVKRCFLKGLTEFQSFLFDQQTAAIDRLLNAHASEGYTYHFINFNYTHCFDKCLEMLGPKGTKLSGQIYCKKIGELIHIHGAVGDHGHGMIMGVNDKSQVKNKAILNKCELMLTIIKPMANENNHLDYFQRCLNAIDSSSIICVFGMSLGKTDNTWWKQIGRNLQEHPDRQLILFQQRNGYRPWIFADYLIAERETQDLFFKNADIAKADRDSLRNRIHIVVNVDLFGGEEIIKK